MLDMKLYNNNCFDIFNQLDDNSVDMVCVDPPYGTTAIKWDNVLDFNRMWVELERITKPKANTTLKNIYYLMSNLKEILIR